MPPSSSLLPAAAVNHGWRGGGDLRGSLHIVVGVGGRCGIHDLTASQGPISGRRRLAVPWRHLGVARRRGAGTVGRDLHGRHGNRAHVVLRRKWHAVVHEGDDGDAGADISGYLGLIGNDERNHGPDTNASK